MIKFGEVCAGISAASLAWRGIAEPAWFAEIEPFPSAVLAQHHPSVINHRDFTRLRDRVEDVAGIDWLMGGTPCQGFSLAGLRKSLDDDRSNLCLEFIRLADAIDDFRRSLGKAALTIIWENVEGVLSTPDNAFGAFLAGLVGGDTPLDPARAGGWPNAGVVSGPRRCAAWRLLDAQHFGLAQRRRRVFVVACGHPGGFRCADALLPLIESVRWHPAPRREARKNITGTLSARTQGGGGLGTDFDIDGGLVTAFGGNNQTGPIDVATACRAKGGSGHMDFESETFVAHALRGEGFDASEDGTGRGTPIVPVQGVALRGRDGGATAELTGDVMTSLRTGGGGGDKPHFLAPSFALQAGTVRENPASGPDGVGVQEGIAYTLEARAEVQAVCFDETQITSAENRCNPQPGDPSHPLAKTARPPTIAFTAKDYGGDAVEDISPTLRVGGFAESHANAGVMPAVLTGWRVRRLLPVECERLMGVPDGYTNIPWRGKPAAPDGPRYKALGNSIAVPCLTEIGRRLAELEHP